MNYILLFLFFFLSCAELVTNKTVEIYYDTLGNVYINYENGYINRIINPQNFHLSAGYGKVTFDIKDHNVNLLHYFPQNPPKVKEDITGYSYMFGKTIHVGVFRGATRTDHSKCTPVYRAREYVRLIELNVRLYTGNQVRLTQGKDLYISSKCLVIDESIYEAAKPGDINNALYADAKKTDKVPNVGVKWFINDDYEGGWIGLATVGSPKIVTNPNSNYWLICKFNPTEEDLTSRKAMTISHEFGHTCGLGHGGTQEHSASGTFTSFNYIDNYGDSANFMGVSTWYHPLSASQYIHVIVGGKPEPWLFKDLEEGYHKYRIYGIDHPYSRYFLGVAEPYHSDSEVFDGIAFKYNCLAIKILVNESMTSKYTGQKNTTGSIMLEYRYNSSLQVGSQEFGLRVTYGPTNPRSNLLVANLDNLKNWQDSHITLGVDYHPIDFDTGTLKIRVTKIHKARLYDFEKQIIQEDKRNYDEAGYAEVEIEFFPKKKYTPPSPPKGLPNFIFSPSYHNCFKLNDESGYNCSKPSSTSTGWYYFINNGNRDRNIPRIYTGRKNKYMRERIVVRSYSGAENIKSTVCYGDKGYKCININVNNVEYPYMWGKFYINAKVTRIKTDDVNKTVEDLGNMNIIYMNKKDMPEGGRIYVTDIYGNEKDVELIDRAFVLQFPSLETDGFSEGGVVFEDKNGKVISYNSFRYFHLENGNRVAIEQKENGEFELSPAAMPSNEYYTIPTMLYPIIFISNTWYYYPVTDLEEDDFIYIDFKGTVPSDLVMTVETDMGEFSKDLSDLRGLNSVSYKLTYMEIHRATGGWAEIGRIKFNKDVEIQNIRPIYRVYNLFGNQLQNVNAMNEEFNFNGYKYKVVTEKIGTKYIYKKVSVDINGETYTFGSSTSRESVKSIGKKGLSTFLIVLIIIGVVVVLIGIIFVFIKIRSKSRSRQAYPGRSTMPPAVGYAGGYRR